VEAVFLTKSKEALGSEGQHRPAQTLFEVEELLIQNSNQTIMIQAYTIPSKS
jgi:hypothetical protein